MNPERDDSGMSTTSEPGTSGRLSHARALRLRGRSTAVAFLLVGSLGLAGCGESSGEKAAKQVCSATKEITTQIGKLQSLAISQSFLTEAKDSLAAISKSTKQIQEASPNLDQARREELEAANKAFQSEIVKITASVGTSAFSSKNLESALKSAEPQIKAALSGLAASYKKAYEALNCSS